MLYHSARVDSASSPYFVCARDLNSMLKGFASVWRILPPPHRSCFGLYYCFSMFKVTWFSCSVFRVLFGVIFRCAYKPQFSGNKILSHIDESPCRYN